MYEQTIKVSSLMQTEDTITVLTEVPFTKEEIQDMVSKCANTGDLVDMLIESEYTVDVYDDDLGDLYTLSTSLSGVETEEAVVEYLDEDE